MENSKKINLIVVINKYKFYLILVIMICILFVFSTYSKNTNYIVYVNNEKVNLSYNIEQIKDKLYISVDDLVQNFSDYTFYDKISSKLIITSNAGVKKIKKTDKDYIIVYKDSLYVDLEKIMMDANYNLIVCKDNIYVFDFEQIDATVLKNRTEVLNNKKVVDTLDKNQEVQVVVDELLLNSNSKFVTVVDVSKKIYGKCLKNNLVYKYMQAQQQSQNKTVFIRAERRIKDNVDTDNINAVIIDMLRVSGKNSVEKLDYELKGYAKKNIYASINSGQNLSNYDPDIISMMLNSDTNREQINKSILKFVLDNNLLGVNIDFGNIKKQDIQLFTQYIKELSAIMKLNNKKVVISITNSQNVDLKNITKFADFVVIKVYGERTTASKISGPYSSVNYVESCIQNILKQKADVNKLIIEIPTNSILWTERGGTVINAEMYSMSAVKQYLTRNNIEVLLDSNSKQNYFKFTKGITTYKMWVEDSYSIEQKLDFVDKYNLAGVSVCENGIDGKDIYENIVNKMKK